MTRYTQGIGGLLLILLFAACGSNDGPPPTPVAPAPAPEPVPEPPPPEDPPDIPSSSLRLSVAAWNIAWFGDGVDDEMLVGNEDGARFLRTEADHERLRGLVDDLVDRGVEVLALQEIENEEAARRLLPASEWNIFVSRRDTAPRWSQRTVTAIRRSSGWRVERHPDVDGWSPDGRSRHGVDLTLSRDGQHLRLLNIHFQSSCHDDPLDSPGFACGRLALQFMVLGEWIEERLEEKVPVVVAGDWNRQLSRRSDQTLALLPGDPLLLPPTGSSPDCWDGRFRYYIDHFLAFDADGGPAEERGFEEVLYDAPRELRDKLSDHCPLIAELAF